MGTTIHQLRGIITSDIKGFVSGMELAGSATRKLRDTWKDASQAIWTMSQRVALAVGAMTVGVTKVFADFEDVMVEVGAITRTLGTRDFELLTNAAREMGATTRYSATEAAQGLKQLATSGLDVKQSITALKPTLELATSAGVSIGQAASISAKLMKAMGIESKDLSHVNDVLVSTFQRGSTDLNSLAEGMKHAAPVAHALGVSLEDTTAILSKLSDAGFVGEMGGTALRNIMSRLAGALPRLNKQFQELGIVTMDSAGNMRPLLDILEEIQQKGLSTGKIMELFGQRGGPQLSALLDQGIASIRNFSYETSQAAGQAAEVMAAKNKTIAGEFDQLKSYIEDLFLEAGKKISPEIVKLIDDLERFFVANKPEIIDQMTKASKGLITGLQSLREWLMNNRESMLQVVHAFGGLIKWMADFAAAHPQLMAGLVALKVSGLLGIYDAALKTVAAIVQTVFALYSQSVAAGVAARSTAGAAAAAGGLAVGSTVAARAVMGLRLALSTLMGPWGLLLGAVTVGIAGWVSQMESFGSAIDDTAEKFRKLQDRRKQAVVDQTGKALDAIGQEATSERRRKLAAENTDAAVALLDTLKEKAKDWNKDPDAELPEKGKRQMADVENQKGQVREFLRKTIDESTALVNPKIVDAARKNKMVADELADSFNKLKKQLTDGDITARAFNEAVDKLADTLDITARGLDPTLEKLFRFNQALEGMIDQDMQIGGDGVRQDSVEFNKILQDLNKYKAKLGDSFQGLVADLEQLNFELELGAISQEQYREGLKKIRQQTDIPAQQDKTGEIEASIKKNKLDEEKSKYQDFETIQGLIGQDDKTEEWDTRHLNPQGIEAIGNSIEGATPEIVGQLVDDFKQLQQQGEGAVQEGMDNLILSFLRAVEKAKDNAEERDNLTDAANEAYKRGGTQSDVKKYGKAGGDSSLSDAFKANQDAAYNGDITEDQYKERDKGLSNVAGQSTSALEDVNKLKEKLDAAAKAAGSFGVNSEKFAKSIQDLTREFADGKIDEDEFTERMKALRESMANCAETGAELIQTQKQKIEADEKELQQKREALALANGDFANAGKQFNFWDAVIAKLGGFQAARFNEMVDWYVAKMYGLGNVCQNVADNVEKLGDGLEYYATKAGGWYEAGNGAMGNIANSWSNFVASIQGQWTLFTNQINEMAQALTFSNLTMTRKLEIQKQIDDLLARRDALLNQPPPTYSSVSYDPIFKDPGIIGGANGQGQGIQNISSPVTISLPSIDTISSSKISTLADMLEQEWRRRGYRR